MNKSGKREINLVSYHNQGWLHKHANVRLIYRVRSVLILLLGSSNDPFQPSNTADWGAPLGIGYRRTEAPFNDSM